MCSITLDLPNEIMYDNHLTKNDATMMARKMLALGLYTQNNVSIGHCAKIAGLTEEEFIIFLGKYGISIFQFEDGDELLRDIENA